MTTVRSKDGTPIVYDIQGSGPKLIYITGAICFRDFGPVKKDVSEFAKAFTVVSYDRRGRGHSGDTLPYAPERELEDLEAIIDDVGAPVFLYGHSSGAAIALEAALKYRNKISSIALYEAPYATSEADRPKNDKFCDELQSLLQRKMNARAIKHFLSSIGMPKIFMWLLPLFPGWSNMKALAPTLMYDMELTRDLPPVDRATKLKVPTLMMYGSKSAYGFKSVSEALAQASSRIKVEVFKDQDHMIAAKLLRPRLEMFFSSRCKGELA